jgi:hypothetical protein
VRISLGDLDYYRESLGQIASMASSHVRDAIQSGGGGVTAMREAAIGALQESVGIHGDMAQALAGQLFDEVCDAEGMGPYDFELYDDIIDFGLLESKVRYFARALVEGDGGRYLDDCAMLAEFYARRCNYEGMIRNCHRNNVRYARVPTGPDTCDFCMMLASRGFVYYTKESAGVEGIHEHCDCVVIPGNGGDATSPTQVEGYDPDMLYDLWQGKVTDMASARASKNGTTYQIERMRIMDGYSRASRRARASRRIR